MNVKLIASAVALALLGSLDVYAGQQFGRDSVYAAPGATYSIRSSAVADVTRPGRASIYVGDVPTRRPAAPTAASATLRPGRA